MVVLMYIVFGNASLPEVSKVLYTATPETKGHLSLKPLATVLETMYACRLVFEETRTTGARRGPRSAQDGTKRAQGGAEGPPTVPNMTTMMGQKGSMIAT